MEDSEDITRLGQPIKTKECLLFDRWDGVGPLLRLRVNYNILLCMISFYRPRIRVTQSFVSKIRSPQREAGCMVLRLGDTLFNKSKIIK